MEGGRGRYCAFVYKGGGGLGSLVGVAGEEEKCDQVCGERGDKTVQLLNYPSQVDTQSSMFAHSS